MIDQALGEMQIDDDEDEEKIVQVVEY